MAFQTYDTCLKGSYNFIGYFETQPLKKSSHFERSMAKSFNRRQNISMISVKLDWISQQSYSNKIIE